MRRKAKKTADLTETEKRRHQLTFACLRMIRGVSTADVARRSGVAFQTIKNMRTAVQDGGTLAPRVDTLAKIGRAFGQPLMFASPDVIERPDVRRSAPARHVSVALN